MTTSWELPLSKVVAVQLLYNGSHTVTETLGAGEQPVNISIHARAVEDLDLIAELVEERQVGPRDRR